MLDLREMVTQNQYVCECVHVPVLYLSKLSLGVRDVNPVFSR